MRFCMVTTFYPPFHFGGDAIYVWRLSNALAQRGHEVHVIHDRDAFHLKHHDSPKGEYPNHPLVTVHTLSRRFGFADLLLTQQLGRPVLLRKTYARLLRETKPDVIHYHNISLAGGFGPITMGRAVKLYTTHEHWLVCPMHILWQFNRRPCEKRSCFACQIRGGRPPQLWRYGTAMPRALSEIDQFLFPSRFTMERHTVWGGLPLPGVIFPPFAAPPKPLPAATPAMEHPYFLIVARLDKIKGVQNAIPAFRNYREADLVVAGSGDYENELRRIAAGMENVRFVGRQSQEALQGLYAGAIATIVPSICYETFGMVIVEAYSNHSAVIAHDLGALAEVMADSGGGLTYRDEDQLIEAMRRLQTREDDRRAMAERGWRYYSTVCSEEAHLTRYLEMIEELRKRKTG
ncbi:glycosyltransferase family 4 protein [Candidatus Sumerlaeota bacterium]|nr:glycosyltransferase family 4 protein [Candidatus Sumerlaeota bacterium]